MKNFLKKLKLVFIEELKGDRKPIVIIYSHYEITIHELKLGRKIIIKRPDKPHYPVYAVNIFDDMRLNLTELYIYYEKLNETS